MRHLLFLATEGINIEFGGYQINTFLKAVYMKNGKDIKSLCFRAVSYIIKKALVIFGDQKLLKKKR
jgi:hypothetical protein